MALSWTPKIDRALAVAARCHREHTRKDSDTPYIAHPVAVALIVSDFTDNEDVAVAALLHDVLEDVPPEEYSAEDMERDFGEHVVEMVRGVSEEKTAGREQAPWRERKEGYLAQLDRDTEECLLICTADKIHNLRSMVVAYEAMGPAMWEIFNATPANKLWFYHAILERVAGRLGDCEATRRLRAAYEEVEALAP